MHSQNTLRNPQGRALAPRGRGLRAIATCILIQLMQAPLHGQQILFKGEANAVGFYSTSAHDLDLARSTPRTSLGLEWGLRGNPSATPRFAFDSADLLLRLTYDPVKRAVVPLPFDTWARFRLRDKNTFRLGHFQLPYGLNPVLAPRNSFILPLAAYDLGFKWDWGAAYKGSLGRYDYEVAGTTGVGERLSWPDGDALVSGRIGTPTYRDHEYGLSVLYGRAPRQMLNHLITPANVNRFRVAADTTLMKRPYRVLMAEAAIGKDGSTPVGGVMLAADYVLPPAPKYSITGQVVSWFTDLARAPSSNALITLAVTRTVSTSATVRLAWVHNLHIAAGQPFMGPSADNRLFLQTYWSFDVRR